MSTTHLLQEDLIHLPKAAALIPGRPRLQTIYRWADTGSRGVRLETIRVGGRRFTSREAIVAERSEFATRQARFRRPI